MIDDDPDMNSVAITAADIACGHLLPTMWQILPSRFPWPGGFIPRATDQDSAQQIKPFGIEITPDPEQANDNGIPDHETRSEIMAFPEILR